MSDDDITVREATLADLPVILHQRHAMFEAMGYRDPAVLDTVERNSEPYFAKGFEEGWYRSWLAQTTDGRVIAGGGVSLVPWPPHPRDGRPCRPMIHNVYTEPEYRRRGIARRLMQVMIDWCRAQGFVVVYLHSSDEGRPLYLSMGFETTSELRLKLTGSAKLE